MLTPSELGQYLTLLLFGQKRCPEGVPRQLAQLSLAEAEDLLGDLVFVRQCSVKHVRVISVQRDQRAGIKQPPDRMLPHFRATSCKKIAGDTYLDRDSVFGEVAHQFRILYRT